MPLKTFVQKKTEISVPHIGLMYGTKSIVNHKQFLDKLRTADPTPVLLKNDKTALKNYRPVSVLTIVSETFERLI